MRMRPCNAYNLFFAETRPKIMAEREAMKKAGAKEGGGSGDDPTDKTDKKGSFFESLAQEIAKRW